MPKEIWKDVIGYEGYYQISNMGKIKSINRITTHNRILKGCILKQFLNKFGYYFVSLSKNNKKITQRVHRLVALTFISNPNNYPEINHIDGNKKNNKVENLEWCTCQQNVQHSFKLGLSIVPKGEKNHCAKLTQKDVDYIRTNYKFRDKNFGTVALSKKFKVCPSTISLIIKNKNWKGE